MTARVPSPLITVVDTTPEAWQQPDSEYAFGMLTAGLHADDCLVWLTERALLKPGALRVPLGGARRN